MPTRLPRGRGCCVGRTQAGRLPIIAATRCAAAFRETSFAIPFVSYFYALRADDVVYRRIYSEKANEHTLS